MTLGIRLEPSRYIIYLNDLNFRSRGSEQNVSTGSATPPPSPSPSLAGTNDESSSDSSDPMMSSTFTQSLLNVATNKLALQLTPPEASIVEASALG